MKRRKNEKRVSSHLKLPFTKKAFTKWMKKLPSNARIFMVTVDTGSNVLVPTKSYLQATYWLDKNAPDEDKKTD